MKTDPFFVPGSQWVYYKFYLGEGFSNNILTERIYPVIRRQLEERIITQWFFIRYHDFGNHLRVRLLASNRSNSLVIILRDFEVLGRLLLGEGYLSDIQISTYKRELSRYGKSNIELVENLWYWETEMIVNSIVKFKNSKEHILCILTAIDLLLKLTYPYTIDKQDFLERNYNHFCHDFIVKKDGKRKLSSKFRELHENMIEWLAIPNDKLASFGWWQNYEENMKAITKKLDREVAPNIVSSLVHMLVNRSFDKSQRKMELVIYHHLYKFYKSYTARNL